MTQLLTRVVVHNFPPKLQLSLQIEANGQQAHGMPQKISSRAQATLAIPRSPPTTILAPCTARGAHTLPFPYSRAPSARPSPPRGLLGGFRAVCSALPPLLTACSSTTRASSGTVSSCDSAPTRDDRPCARETSVALTTRTSAAPSPARRTATPHRNAHCTAPHRTTPARRPRASAYPVPHA